MKNKQWNFDQDGQAVADSLGEKLTHNMRFFLAKLLGQLPESFLKKIVLNPVPVFSAFT